jgi:hypothetical protein
MGHGYDLTTSSVLRNGRQRAPLDEHTQPVMIDALSEVSNSTTLANSSGRQRPPEKTRFEDVRRDRVPRLIQTIHGCVIGPRGDLEMPTRSALSGRWARILPERLKERADVFK